MKKRLTLKSIIYKGHETVTTYPKNKTIHQLFEEQVEKTPNNIAVVFEDKQLTYKELNEKSNQLARYIRKEYKNKTKMELTSDTLIVLFLDKSLEMMIGILAILKAGGAYVPIDPSYPQERTDYILEDTKAKLVLTKSHLLNNSGKLKVQNKKEKTSPKEELALSDYNVLQIDLTNNEIYDGNAVIELNIFPQYSSNSLAYVIYTSGTTGKPKGVMIEHHSVVNLIIVGCKKLGLYDTEVRKCLWFSSYVFDVHVVDVFTSILHGHILHIISNNVRNDLHLLQNYILQNSIYIAFIPPILLDHTKLLNLNVLIVGGEVANINSLNSYTRQKTKVINAYGPTESTVYATMHEYKSGDINTNIGTPIANMKCYILDQSKKPVPAGTIGELYLGGAGIARGYLNRHDLTHEKFIPNSFASEEDIKNGYTRLYKTGDLCRYLEDGNIEYIGRNDDQVKIRGYRIELGEIEAALLKIDGIKQTCVIAKSKETTSEVIPYLLGYYVLDDTVKIKLTEDEILSILAKYLPDYMIPTQLVEMEKFPMSVNGKLDKKSLPEPKYKVSADYIAPKEANEIRVCEVFANVLEIKKEQISINDSFLKLGGNSISIMKLIYQLMTSYQLDISFQDIMSMPKINITNIVSFLDQQILFQATKTKLILNSKYPIFPIQRQVFSLKDSHQFNSQYNTQSIYEFSGKLNAEILRQSLEFLFQKHSILRTIIIFDEELGIISQRILANNEFKLPYIVKNDMPKNEISDYLKNEVQVCYQIGELLCRISLIISETKTIFCVCMQHLLTDSWAQNMFFKQLEETYNHLLNGNSLTALKYPASSYQLIVKSEDQVYNSKSYKQDFKFWKNELEGFSPTKLPFTQITLDFNVVKIVLPKNLYLKLQKLRKQLDVSLFSILISTYSYVLSVYTEKKDLSIGFPYINRNSLIEFETMGYLSNTLIYKNVLDGSISTEKYLIDSHRKLQKIQSHSSIPYAMLAKDMETSLNLDKILFDSMFVLQNATLEHSDIKLGNAIGVAKDSYHSGKEKFNLLLDLTEDEKNGLSGYIEFNPLISLNFIENVIRSYQNILESLADKLEDPLNKILLSNSQIDQLLEFSKSKHIGESKFDNIIDNFEYIVKNYPNSIAVIDNNNKYTYLELSKMSNQVTNKLLSIGIKFGDFIVVSIDNSLELFSLILGIMKTGAIYVPIALDIPKDRLVEVTYNCKAALLIYGDILLNDENLKIKHLQCNDFFNNVKDFDAVYNMRKLHENSYVIYTSGSTGVPKAVCQTHKSLNSCLSGLHEVVQLSKEDIVLQHTPISFDISVQEIIYPLIIGASLCVTKNHFRKDPTYLMELIKIHQITVANFVPSFLRVLLDSDKFRDQAKTLHKILIGGEAITLDLINKLCKNMLNCHFYNVYGPSEAFYVTAKKMSATDNIISIGKAIGKAELFILDTDKNPVAVGVIGELYVGGDGLASGYLNNSLLSKEKFINLVIFNQEMRLYRTGDLVRWLANGDIEYINRMDYQVKVNGNRVELSGIEMVLSELGFNYPIVIKNQNEISEYLIAYYIGLPYDEQEIIKIKQQLTLRLPNYEVPRVFIPMQNYPISINGKIDRKKLPPPQIQATNKDISIPTTEEEFKIAEAWADILKNKVENFDIDTTFSNYGIDSLAMIALLLRINKIFNKKFSMSWLQNNPTIRMQAKNINKNSDTLINVIKSSHLTPVKLILLHPGGQDISVYGNIIKEITGECEIITVDHYNLYYNQGTQLNREGLLDKYYTELRAYVKSTDFIILAGFSLGGSFATSLAQKFIIDKYLVKKIVLIDSAYYANATEHWKIKDDVKKCTQDNIVNANTWNSQSLRYSEVLLNDAEMSVEFSLDRNILAHTPVLLFKAKHLLNGFINQKYNGWGVIFDNIKLIDVDANHFTILSNNEICQQIVLEIKEIIESLTSYNYQQ